MEKIFVTGAAGFIGSHLAERLLALGKSVVGWDNFSTGQPEFVSAARQNPNFTLIEGDCLDQTALTRAMAGCDFVFHLAANADVRFGLQHPSKDLHQNATAISSLAEQFACSKPVPRDVRVRHIFTRKCAAGVGESRAARTHQRGGFT